MRNHECKNIRRNCRTRYSALLAAVMLVCMLFAFTLPACNGFAPYDAEDFEDYCDELFKSYLTDDPLSVSFFLTDPAAYGLENGKAKVTVPLDKSTYESAYNSYSSLIAYLLFFDLKTFSDEQKVTYATLIDSYSRASKFGEFYYLQDGFLEPRSGMNVNIPMSLTQYELRSVSDVKAYTDYISALADAFPKYVAYEEQRIAAGYGKSDYIYNATAQSLSAFAPIGEDENNFLISVFNQKTDALDFLDAQQKTEYQSANRNAVVQKLLPAYRSAAAKYLTFVGGEKNNQQGLSHYTDGAKYYECLIRREVGTDDTAPEIYANCKSALAKTYTALQAKISEVMTADPSLTDANAVQTAIDNMLAAADYSVNALRTDLTMLSTACQADMPSLGFEPEIRFDEVNPTLSEQFALAAYYHSPLDDLRSAEKIVVNTSLAQSGNANYYPIEVMAHEGYPGHLLQSVYEKQLQYHKVKSMLNYSGYSEGWATYVESYVSSYLGGTEVEKLLYEIYYLNDYAGDLVTVLSDVAVNYYGDSRDGLLQRISTKFGLQPNAPVDESRRAYANSLYNYSLELPSNAAKYTYSALKLFDLREKYAQKLGGEYTDLKYNTEVLNAGKMSFDMLEAYVLD